MWRRTGRLRLYCDQGFTGPAVFTLGLSETNKAYLPFYLSMFKRILVPMDVSSASVRALRTAVGLADDGGELLILGVVDLSGSLSAPAMAKQERIQTKELLAIQRRAKAYCRRKKVKAASEIVVGRPSDAVVSFAREKRVDLVVMGRSGTGFNRRLARLLLGSVSNRIVQACDCAVFITH